MKKAEVPLRAFQLFSLSAPAPRTSTFAKQKWFGEVRGVKMCLHIFTKRTEELADVQSPSNSPLHLLF
jgi:hypothetical protein